MRNLLRKQSEKFADLIFAAINGTFKNAEVNMHSGIYAYSHLKEPPIITQKGHLKLRKAATEI